MSERGDGGGRGGPEAVLRAVGVVALVAVAALTLQARQGLDWEELADPLQVRWARVLAGSVLLLALGVLGRRLRRRLRRPRWLPSTAGRHGELAGEPFPWHLRVLAVLLVLVAVGLAWFLVDAVAGGQPGEVAPRDLPGPGEAATSGRPAVTWWTLAQVAAVLTVVSVAARVAGRRAGRRTAEEPPAAEEPVVARLAAAVTAAEAGLHAPGDARAAIVSAYAAMAASISAGLARRGGPAKASDTPTELLDRAVSAHLVDARPASTLTDLFREARFSRHPMGDEHRRAAEAALAGVRDGLEARHGRP